MISYLEGKNPQVHIHIQINKLTNLKKEEADNTNLEPINGTTIDEGREHPQSIAEGISNRTHGQHYMEV